MSVAPLFFEHKAEKHDITDNRLSLYQGEFTITYVYIYNTSMEATIVRLTLNSLALLGFKANLYYNEHPQLRCNPLDAHSFDSNNEKSLLLALHFLLSQLNPNFQEAVEEVWPHYDAKGKNGFKIAVQQILDDLAAADLVPSECCKASVLSTAKGFIVWILLWKLSNAVFVKLSANQDCTSDLDALKLKVGEEHEKMIAENRVVIRRQREQYTYSDDLYTRFKKAKKNIDKLQRDMASLETGEDTGPLLTETARIARTQMTLQIEEACVVLKRLTQSPGFSVVQPLIDEGVSAFPEHPGISSVYFADYLSELNSKIMADPRDRRYYAIVDEYDINEHLDVLIDKLSNSNSVVPGLPGSEFGQVSRGPVPPYTGIDDEMLLTSLNEIPDSVETIKRGLQSIAQKLNRLNAMLLPQDS